MPAPSYPTPPSSTVREPSLRLWLLVRGGGAFRRRLTHRRTESKTQNQLPFSFENQKWNGNHFSFFIFHPDLCCLSTTQHSRSALALGLSTGNLSTANLRWRWVGLRWTALALNCAEAFWRWRCAALGERRAGLRWRWAALTLALAALALALAALALVLAALALALGPAALACAGAGLRWRWAALSSKHM